MSASGKTPTGNLPAELTSFVGRRAELSDVRQALETGRLVTLIGAGGVGKTRLAQRAASAARRAFRDGAWLVDVSPLRDEALLAPTIAAALGLQSRTTRWAPAVLSEQLANRALLLVLDNCEHMSDACAVVVEALLTRCPEVRVLATSRQPLDIPGEYLLAVHPLEAPGYGDRCVAPVELRRFDAVTLFVERARALEPRFELTQENAEAVAELCYRLDGLPLAVELAAARVRHLSPQQMLDRLEPGYDLLSSRSSVTPPRQRSLRSLVEWSHDLCDASERLLWARLSVFAGGFGAEAAEAVCAGGELPREAVLPALASLVDKSVVVSAPGEPEVRFHMLEVIRAFGSERLVAAGEEADIRRAHRDHFWHAVAADYPRWFGPNQLRQLRWCRVERDNLRSAIDFSLQAGEAAAAAVLATALAGEAIISGLHAEGLHWIDRVRIEPLVPALERARLLWVGASCALQQGDLEAAGPLLDEAFGLASELGDHHETAMAVAYRGTVLLMQGRVDDALDVFQRALSSDELDDDPLPRALVTVGMAAAVGQRGDVDRAVTWCREAIAISEACSDEWHKAQALCQLADLLRQRGQEREATEAARRSLQLNRLFSHAVGTAQCFDTLAGIAVLGGDAARAARLLGAADALRQGTDVRLPGLLVEHRADVIAWGRREIGRGAFDEARAAGQRSTVEDNVAFAMGEPGTDAAPVSPAGSSLTRREREIAAMVATGASNKEIATSLVISPRTAEGHVVHILNKLGFTSRVQIAAWVSGQTPSP
jgi:non-specific serine/threonine protein kinase